MSGMTVLKRLRLAANTPVLVLSALNREVDIVAALDGGVCMVRCALVDISITVRLIRTHNGTQLPVLELGFASV